MWGNALDLLDMKGFCRYRYRIDTLWEFKMRESSAFLWKNADEEDFVFYFVFL